MIEALGRDQEGRASGIAVQEEPERSVVKVWGEVDLAVRQAAAPVCQAVAQRGLPVVIDATDVSFVDSAGMSILVRIARDAEAGGYPVVLADAPWMLKELLTITGVDRLLPFAEGEDSPEHPSQPEHPGA